MSENIRTAVCGAAGRMGREVVRAIIEAKGYDLAAAIDQHAEGQDAGKLAGCPIIGIPLQTDLKSALKSSNAHVLVDFTLPDSVMNNILISIEMGVHVVVGTTGLGADAIAELDEKSKARGTGVFIAPNFAIGAVLMMQFAAQAAKYMPDVQIIELHHEKKLDSPSGTALLTAQKIAAARREAGATPLELPKNIVEKSPGALGARDSGTEGIPIHSVRLPGFVAHQEVIFGGVGQTLTIRHDSLDRQSFMPGVLLAVGKVQSLRGVVIGLEKLL